MDIVSKQGRVHTSEQNLFAFLTDLRNLEPYIPRDKVEEWHATEDECTIALPQVGRLTLRITEKEPFRLIRVEPVSGNAPFSFRFYIQIKEAGPLDTRIMLTLRAEMNRMMGSLFQGPVKKGLDQVVDTLSAMDFTEITE